jgi:hypothetical protein
MKKMIWIAAVFVCALAMCARGAWADTIFLTSGQEIKGLVVDEYRDRVILSTPDGEVLVMKELISDIFYDLPEQNYWYLGNRAFEERNFDTAKMLYRRSLELNPDYTESHDALFLIDEMRYRLDFGIDRWDVDRLQVALRRSLGFTIRAAAGMYVVDILDEKSPASGAGIQMQDRIVAVWSSRVGYRELRDAAAMFIGAPDTSIKLTLRRPVIVRNDVPDDDSSEGTLWLDVEAVEGKGLVVAGVNEKSASQTAKVKRLDRIVMLNGKSTRYMPFDEVRRVLAKAAHQDLYLEIERDVTLFRKRFDK